MLSTNKLIVLWVRHCISCSNVAEEKDTEQRYLKEPLCTSEGIVHAIVSGDRISKFIKTNFPNQEVEIFSSFLPRAMETAKLISSELIDHSIIETPSSKKIRRLPFVSELWSDYEMKVSKGKGSSTSTTTREKSDVHANFLNEFLPQIGLKIDVDDEDSLLEIQRECPLDISSSKTKKRCKLDMRNGYDKFFENIIIGSSLFSKKINIIVSHGAFMEKHIVKPAKLRIKYVDNVDSALVEYDLNSDNGKGIVEQKLLHYLKSPLSTTPKKLDRRIILKLNSYEIKKIIESKFANCEYTYEDIKMYS